MRMDLLSRIYVLLLPDERKKGCRMAMSVFLSALLDLMGLAALLPVLYYLLGEGDKHEAALQFCFLAIGIILVKSVLSTCFIRYQNQCLFSFYKRLSFSLYSSYYCRGLLFIREQGSSRLGYQINSMCYAFSHSLLAPIFRMMGDVLLMILVTLALLLWNGKTVMLLYASFIPFMCVYFLFVRKRVRKYGTDDMNAKREQSRIVMDTFRGYVELEVNGAFPVMQSAFLSGIDRIGRNRMKLDTLVKLPMFLSELSVVIALGVIVAWGSGDVGMLVGFFAIAAFRLLSALRSVLLGWTQIQNALCCLDVIEEGLDEYEQESELVITFERSINIEKLCYEYPDSELILKEFDCRITKGEYVGFCGTSGVGKSTLFNLLIGLIEPNSGHIRVDDTLLTNTTRKSWMNQIGYVPQEVFIFKGTLAENIAIGCQTIDYCRIKELLTKVSLDNWVETLPDGLHTQLSEAGGKLSGGQKQRIGIARALYKKVSVLLLDEATSALDNMTEREINRTLQQLKENNEGLTILSIAHRESSLSFCDRIITIE